MSTNNFEHQFIIYSDSCSGVAGTEYADNLRKINQHIVDICPAPDFICFSGDEIIGLTNNELKLQEQWDYWKNTEMKYFYDNNIPIYNTTGNHTTYNSLSEKVFKDTFHQIPHNGPDNQIGLSYYIIRGNLLMIFVNTCSEILGGEGRVETEWIEKVLLEHKHIEHKLVIGHHPIFPPNGFTGDFSRNIETENGKLFHQILVKNKVLAYVCSHLLAFDIQVQEGVLQLMSAGAGTPFRMPEGIEYLHFVIAQINNTGFSFQVIDIDGNLREQLSWPLKNNNLQYPISLKIGNNKIPFEKWNDDTKSYIKFQITGKIDANSSKQTILYSSNNPEEDMPQIWIGLTGIEKRLTILINPTQGRSPRHWYGPILKDKHKVDLDLILHKGMGPCGILWKMTEEENWSSCLNANVRGLENLPWIENWHIENKEVKIKYETF